MRQQQILEQRNTWARDCSNSIKSSSENKPYFETFNYEAERISEGVTGRRCNKYNWQQELL